MLNFRYWYTKLQTKSGIGNLPVRLIRQSGGKKLSQRPRSRSSCWSGRLNTIISRLYIVHASLIFSSVVEICRS